jgi:hypothetical protein
MAGYHCHPSRSVNPPGILPSPSLSLGPTLLPPSLLICELRISILIPLGKGHGVVFGRGNDVSEGAARGGGGGFRRRAMMGARRRSTTYGDVLVGKYDFVWSDIVSERGVEDRDVNADDSAGENTGELGIGRSMSWVSGSVLFSKRDASYAIVVSTICRNIMKRSSPNSCNLDGTYATVKVTLRPILKGSARHTQANKIKDNSSPFRRALRRMMPYTGCIEEQDIEEEEAEGPGCRGIEVSWFRALNLGDETTDE